MLYPGSDLALIRLVDEAMQSAGWHTNVDTGRMTFPAGDSSRNVYDGPVDSGQLEDIFGSQIDGIAYVSGEPDEL